ncbi:hypothetical protein D3C84_1081340 [compost metagenome]
MASAFKSAFELLILSGLKVKPLSFSFNFFIEKYAITNKTTPPSVNATSIGKTE